MVDDIESKEEEYIAQIAHPRMISNEQMVRFEGYMGEIFTALGMDISTPSTIDTPRRYLQAMIESTEGYEGDPKLLKTFRTECRGGPDCQLSQIVEGPIHFFWFVRASCSAILRARLCRIYCS